MGRYATWLVGRPTFWGGAASVMDIGGTLVEYNQSLTPEQADALAIYSDWRAVGDDIRVAVDAYGKQLPAKR